MITQPSGGRSSLTRAALSIHHPPAQAGGKLGGQIAKVDLQFNPNQLQLTRSASWSTQPAVALERGASPEFTGAEPASLELEVFLDDTRTPTAPKVRKQVERLLTCCEVDPQSVNSKRPSPPWVQFSWGSFDTVSFVAYVERVTATYSLFNPAGEPLRATCQVSLREVPQSTKGQNPTSGALSAQRVHQVVAGDSLASLAWSEYGDPTAWRAIAEANDIDDPMRLRPGDELLMPAVDEIDRTG